MFAHKCTMCQRSLLKDGIMCGVCMDALRESSASRIAELCKRAVDGMESKIPPEIKNPPYIAG